SRSLVLAATKGPLDVILMFEAGASDKPVILGCVAQEPAPQPVPEQPAPLRLLLAAQQEIEFRCGKSVIRLSKNGRVLIEGDAIVSRGRKSQRILGGTILLN